MKHNWMQITYKGSKLCLIEEHGRNIVHHNILVMNYEGTTISRPWNARAELGVTCILEHVVEFEGERLLLLKLLLLLLLHSRLGWSFECHPTRNSFSSAHSGRFIFVINEHLLARCCSNAKSLWVCAFWRRCPSPATGAMLTAVMLGKIKVLGRCRIKKASWVIVANCVASPYVLIPM